MSLMGLMISRTWEQKRKKYTKIKYTKIPKGQLVMENYHRPSPNGRHHVEEADDFMADTWQWKTTFFVFVFLWGANVKIYFCRLLLSVVIKLVNPCVMNCNNLIVVAYKCRFSEFVQKVLVQQQRIEKIYNTFLIFLKTSFWYALKTHICV